MNDQQATLTESVTESHLPIEDEILDNRINLFCQSVADLLRKIHERCGTTEELESLLEKLTSLR